MLRNMTYQIQVKMEIFSHIPFLMKVKIKEKFRKSSPQIKKL